MDEGSGSSGRPSVTSYISIGAERNSKGWNVSAKASTWVTTPLPEVNGKQHSQISERMAAGTMATAAVAVESFEALLMEGMPSENVEVFKAAVMKLANDLMERKKSYLQGETPNEPDTEGTGVDDLLVESTPGSDAD